jgi:hypothetical protein
MYSYFWTMPALMLAVTPNSAAAGSREVVINYADPHGLALTLAILPFSDQLPAWMTVEGKSGTGDDIGPIALAAGGGGEHTRYLFSLQPADKPSSAAGTSEAKIDLGLGQTVEVKQSSETLPILPVCEPIPHPQLPCRISDLSRDLAAIELRHADSLSTELRNLITANNLVVDDQAAKRVVAVVDGGNHIQYADFIGVVRGKDEILPAPDAASVFVVRLSKGGELSIVERKRDSTVGASDFKFAFEE